MFIETYGSTSIPENQRGDSGLSEGMPTMVTKWFRSLFEALQTLFFVSAEKKNEKRTLRKEQRWPVRRWNDFYKLSGNSFSCSNEDSETLI